MCLALFFAKLFTLFFPKEVEFLIGFRKEIRLRRRQKLVLCQLLGGACLARLSGTGILVPGLNLMLVKYLFGYTCLSKGDFAME